MHYGEREKVTSLNNAKFFMLTAGLKMPLNWKFKPSDKSVYNS